MNQNQLDGALEEETVAIAYNLQSLGLKTVILVVFSGNMWYWFGWWMTWSHLASEETLVAMDLHPPVAASSRLGISTLHNTELILQTLWTLSSLTN